MVFVSFPFHYTFVRVNLAFADRSNLRAHMQTHSADKNFECQRCHKTFALKSYLNKHLESSCFSHENDVNGTVAPPNALAMDDNSSNGSNNNTITLHWSHSRCWWSNKKKKKEINCSFRRTNVLYLLIRDWFMWRCAHEHKTHSLKQKYTHTQTQTHTLLLYIWSFWRQSLGANKITVK